jgi:propanol-preferring alcohol dehydrogenase
MVWVDGDIRSARIHEYNQPLELDKCSKPVIRHDEEVLIKVGAAGLCHSDLHLINGEWKNIIPLNLPKTPGHEISGWIEDVGKSVPEYIMKPGDLVAVFGGWGCGWCIYCKSGDEQLCAFGKWPGLSSFDGGFSEYVLVPTYRFLVNVRGSGAKPENLAPLTDAGLTPYRAIKKVKSMLGPGRNIGILGIGGLGSYAVQYAKILGGGSKVFAMDRSDDKLELASKCGADHLVNLHSTDNLVDRIKAETGNKMLDVIIDCVGTDKTFYDSISILAKGGSVVIVGLFGTTAKIPIAMTVLNEYKIFGSLWGNYNELRQVIELFNEGRIMNNITKFRLDDINEAIKLLKEGQIIGRGVLIP